MRKFRTQIEHWPVEKFVAYEHNPREHPATQIRELATSIERFGWTAPILASPGGEVIAGHGRLLAAAKLSIPEVPVIVLSDLSESDIRSLRIADNRMTDLGQWDFSKLVAEVDGIDGDIPGFTALDMEKLRGINPGTFIVTEDDVKRAESEKPRPGRYADTSEIVCPKCGGTIEVS